MTTRKPTSKQTAAESKLGAKRAAKVSKPPQILQKTSDASVAAKQSKSSIAIALLEQPNGASLQELQKALDWQPHSVRGYLSGVIKKRLALSLVSKKIDGERRYLIEGR